MATETGFRSYDFGILLFFAIALPMLYWRLAVYKKNRIVKYLSVEKIAKSIPRRSWHVFITRSLCLIMAWCLLYLSLIGSTSESDMEASRQITSKIQLDEVAFFLDVSNSMNVTDTSTGVSRLNRAKEIMESIIENLGGINISLTAFSGATQTVISSTEDYLYFRILLETLNGDEVPIAGTNLSTVVDTVKREYIDSPIAKSVLVVLLTDGEDTGFLGLESKDRLQAEAALVDHIAKAKSDSLQWDVIGLGTEKGAIVPDVVFARAQVVSSMQLALLKQIAEAGEGRLYVEQRSSLNSIVDNVLADISSKQKSPTFFAEKKESSVSESPQPYFPMIGALFLILAALSLPEGILYKFQFKI